MTTNFGDSDLSDIDDGDTSAVKGKSPSPTSLSSLQHHPDMTSVPPTPYPDAVLGKRHDCSDGRAPRPIFSRTVKARRVKILSGIEDDSKDEVGDDSEESE